jgi:hypothetical protein
LAALVFGMAVSVPGCQAFAGRSTTERLDASTGMTLSTAEQVMVFARTESRYSRSGRDYIYLGPVETNRQGLREYFLWVGIATTLDRGYLAPEIDLPDSLQVTVHGEPMVFELRPWSEAIPGLTPTNVYRTNVALQAQLGSRTTRDQLRVLAEAAPDSIRIGRGEGRTRVYETWKQGPVSWSDLLGATN